MRKQILLFFLLALPFCGAAQQDWLNTQYMFNLFDINSAYAGNHRTPSIALRHRSQWLGMEGCAILAIPELSHAFMERKVGSRSEGAARKHRIARTVYGQR